MTSTIQRDVTVTKENVLRALNIYTLEEIESNLAVFYLDMMNMDYLHSSFLRDLTDTASEDDGRDIIRIIFNGPIESVNLQSILRTFELAVPESEREVNGVYYTPEMVIHYIVENSIDGDDTVCDCACGAGAFLVKAAKMINESTSKTFKDIISGNIWGVDILEDNVRETKILLSLLAAENGELLDYGDFNIYQANSLRLDWGETCFPIAEESGFDAVVGNPPYLNIQTIDKTTKEYVLDEYDTVRSGNFNIYIPFIELGIDLINEEGTVGYVLPLNYFTTLTGEALREYLQRNKYVSRIIDFGDTLLFDDALTYTAITLFTKKPKSSIKYLTTENVRDIGSIPDKNFVKVEYSSINSDKWRLLDDTEFDNISRIESFRPLDDIANIHTGIATLKDYIYIIDGVKSKNGYYLEEYNGNEYRIEKEITEELIKISSISGLEDLENNAKRIILPYKKQSQHTLSGDREEIMYEIMPEKDLMQKYPETYNYLRAAQDELATREKGRGVDYSPWYKYGRKQGLEYMGERLYTPTYSHGPKFLHHRNEYALFSNGYAVFPTDIDINTLGKLLNSKVMDYYIRKTSKEIQGGYQCYQKNFIRRFSVPRFTSEEEQKLLQSDKETIDRFLIQKYGVKISNP